MTTNHTTKGGPDVPLRRGGEGHAVLQGGAGERGGLHIPIIPVTPITRIIHIITIGDTTILLL